MYDLYVPRPGFSVRPPDLPAADTVDLGEHVAVTTPAPPAAAVTVADGSPEGGPRRWRPSLRRLVEVPLLVAAAILCAFLVKTVLVQTYYIPSESMSPALQIGDRLLVEKVSYRFREPARGEIIVFRNPPTAADGAGSGPVRSFLADLGLVSAEEIALVKRVVGLPGETVEIRGGRVIVDGRVLPEPAVVPDGRSFPPVAVPDDSLYLLGDNRVNSDDSRYSLGAVPRDEVVGRAVLLLWPPGHASLSLQTHYAGDDSTTDDGRSAPVMSPPALPRTDNAPEAPPP